MKKFFFIIGAVLINFMVEGCASRRSEPLMGPLESGNPQVNNGQIVFMAHCQKCHPLGEGGLGPAINSNPAPGFIKRFQIRHGLGVMPSFKEDRISRKEIRDLTEYLKAMRHNKK